MLCSGDHADAARAGGKQVRGAMSEFLDALSERVLVLDGAMGTELLARIGELPEVVETLNVDRPEVVLAVHRAYVEAGADVIETNTFGASPIKLGAAGMADRTEELNRAAVDLARRAAAGAGRRVFVAGSLGPVGELVRPLGPLAPEEVQAAYRRQAKALAQAGVDLLLVETQIDLLEAKLAVLGCREAAPDVPLAVSVTFPMNELTVTGSGAREAGTSLEALPVDLVGVNCGGHPEEFLALLGGLLATTARPLAVYANAGLPEKREGRLVYPLGPEEFSDYAERFADLGASLVGGCCGTTPAHVREMARRLAGRRSGPRARPPEGEFRAASRARLFRAGAGLPLAIVGEAINPFGKSASARKVRQGDMAEVRALARVQEQAGASALDVNLGRAADKEPELMARAVAAAEAASTLPLFVDAMTPEAVEQGLRAAAGKPVINSVHFGADWRELFRLARRYGAGVVLLAMDEDGIPDTASGRLAVLERLAERAFQAGLKPWDLICDPVVTSAAAGEPSVTLETIRLLAERGFVSICGLSNVSHGLPARSVLNAAFLAMAGAAGLDAAIADPRQVRVSETAAAVSALAGRDRAMRAFVARFGQRVEELVGAATGQGAGAAASGSAAPRQRLEGAVIEGEAAAAASAAEALVAGGMAPMAVVQEVLVPALEEVGRRYEERVYFLPQLMASAEAAQAAAEVVRRAMPPAEAESGPVVVLATVRGDVHDIGKNIVALVLANHGYRVVDLGKNVPAEEILEAALRHGAVAVGLSALMTTTMDAMAEVVRLRDERAPGLKVLIGGAAVSEAFCREIGADAYGKDAVDAVRKLSALLEEQGGGKA